MLLIGFPNNKYHPNTKNCLPCLLLGGRGGRLVLGGRDYSAMQHAHSNGLRVPP